MAVTTSEKDFNCANCGHFSTNDHYCRALSPSRINPQQDAGSARFTKIDDGHEKFRWCGHWKRRTRN